MKFFLPGLLRNPQAALKGAEGGLKNTKLAFENIKVYRSLRSCNKVQGFNQEFDNKTDELYISGQRGFVF